MTRSSTARLLTLLASTALASASLAAEPPRPADVKAADMKAPGGAGIAAPAAPADDRAAITQTVLDYCEGWYEGDAERMERALHPDLAKRIVRTSEGRSRLDQMSAMGLVLGVRSGYGKRTPKERQLKDVTVLDVFENAASAKAVMSDWIDYLHLARWNGRWVIVNVLWEMKPKS